MTFSPQPKHPAIRSPELMRRYRELACQICYANDGTVCGAHSNWGVHGKAKARKADDNRCASLCFRCHAKIDSGHTSSEAERKALWWTAHVSTIARILYSDRWPMDVPVPDLTDASRP